MSDLRVGDLVRIYDGRIGILAEIDSVGCCRVYDGDDTCRKWFSPQDVRVDDALRLLGALLDSVDDNSLDERVVARIYARALRDSYGVERVNKAWSLVTDD